MQHSTIAKEKKKNEIEIGKTRILNKILKLDNSKLKLFIEMHKKTVYFAYGSNLFKEQMLERCPHAIPFKSTSLMNYKLTFVGHESRWGGGVATIMPNPGVVTYGALYLLEPEDVEKLDVMEAVGQGIYQKINLEIGNTKAYTYVCNYKQKSLPSKLYLETIMKGYEDWNLPINVLTKIITCD